MSHGDELDPEHEALLADSVGLAPLVVLDTLTPAERLAFVLQTSAAASPQEQSERRSRPRAASGREG